MLLIELEDMEINRRQVLQATAAGAAGAIGINTMTNEVEASSFSQAETPTSKTLYSVSHTSRGPIAVGGGGKILHRTPVGWEVVLESGIQTSGSALFDSAVTSDGDVVWVCGSSGVVGTYDMRDGRVCDYTNPSGITSTWEAVSVRGGAGNEIIHLVSSSGQLLRGERDGCSNQITWKSVQKPSGGNAIYGHDQYQYNKSQLCGSGGAVYESTDSGASWSQIGISNFGKTLYDVSSTRRGRASAAAGGGYIADYDGSSWTTTSQSGTAIYTVERYREKGVAAGKSGYIYTRSSGSWSRNDTGTSATFHGCSLPARSGSPDIVVGTGGTVFERGSYDPVTNSIEVGTSRNDTLEYSFEVVGDLSKGKYAESADSVDACSSGSNCYVASGSVDGQRAGRFDSYEFAGDIQNLNVSNGSARHLELSLDSQTLRPYQIASTSWASASVPVSKTLYDVTDSSAGLYAVGGGGKVLNRTGTESWEVVIKNGPSSNGNTQYCCATTEDGKYLWFGGASGALGVYNVETGEITDHTAPNNMTSSWYGIEVIGDSGSETVHLSNGSGKLLTGTRSSGSMDWGSSQTPGSGSAIPAIEFLDSNRGFIVDTNGDAFKSSDGGDTWQNFGIENNGGTPHALSVRNENDILVSAGSGYLLRWNGEGWNRRALGGGTRYDVCRDDLRDLVVGGSGFVSKRGPRGWETQRDSGATLQGVTILEGTAPIAVAVGGSGTILEQTFDQAIY